VLVKPVAYFPCVVVKHQERSVRISASTSALHPLERPHPTAIADARFILLVSLRCELECAERDIAVYLVELSVRSVQVDGVKLLDRFSNRKAVTGTLYLTATHLIFVDPDGKRETWVMFTSFSIFLIFILYYSKCYFSQLTQSIHIYSFYSSGQDQ